MARSRVRPTAARRPSMALTAFASFSALVVVSVALSNGSAPAPWESAYASEASESQQSRGTFEQVTAHDQGESRPSLFAAVPDDALIPDVQDTPQDDLASQVRNVSDRGTESGPSSVAPAKRAPATFEGELPFNTIIAPAQPPTVLDGGQFGWRTAPDTGDREFHNGTDISTYEGTPVVAALEGTVTAVFWDEWGGNRVEVSHADGVKTTYNHLKDVMVQVGDPLKASEQLGTIGQTGLRVTGPHLHFETWVQGKAVDAQSFDWETGEGIIPASRPKYSLEDQARTDQATTDNGSVPGTDNGPVSEVPVEEQDRIIALSQETAPADNVAAGSPDEGAGSGSGSEDGSGSDGGAGAAPEPSSAKAQPSRSQKPKTSPSPSRPAQPSPSRSSSGSDDDAEGRVNAGGPSDEAPNATPSRPSGGTSQGSGSGAPSNTSEKDTGTKAKATKKPTPSKPAAAPEPTKSASTGGPVEPAPANTGKPTPQPTPSETGTSNPQPTVGETDKPKPAPTNTKKPVPLETAEPADKPKDPKPETTKAPQPETTKSAEPPKAPKPETTKSADSPEAPKPETTKPAVPGTPAEPGTPTGAPKPETPSKTDKPAKPTVNPYTADITTLTTLEQLQQRTQVLVNQQLTLTPEQQFGPRSQLNVQLPLLSQQLVAAELDQQVPKFTAQLAATQTAVEKAAAAPKNKKLTDAATAELTKLQTMLVEVPAYVDPAAAQAG
ncbi:peptidoglycan DD-metalloendopeptidase family protein [Kocuria sp. cx-116]|uniref:M23 family metallopeptidase n=1 Tax=Kocuria sp. cx-116 TaxID=2771378 RepID=UPI001683DAC0|nr:M23 family metallopeptidase [Kocuria sp. cx-116]MBD2763258.1 peptidoglycan DD-metalloendopeptidase family protein [Kocuria sp. cx-116]